MCEKWLIYIGRACRLHINIRPLFCCLMSGTMKAPFLQSIVIEKMSDKHATAVDEGDGLEEAYIIAL